MTSSDIPGMNTGLLPPVSVPVPYRIIALMQERNRLYSCSPEHLAAGIRASRFRCAGCGACCTKAVSSHIFLLDRDVEAVQAIDPAAYVPAPDPEFCDQDGTLYVSGYALRMRDDTTGSCWFLDNGRCRIYDKRFSGCRIYPHMSRRSADTSGSVRWRGFARKYRHGHYDAELSGDESLVLARQVMEYENAYLSQQIAFLETIHEYFLIHDLRHDPVMHRQQVQRLRHGGKVTVRVYHAGDLETWKKADPSGYLR
ncbi:MULTISPECIES: YkgJ family cysteine cluster protein [unclassified Methanoregula]|uniref:YkgJ family cysteine cluster protein n=1 Tax=unclassified Methanoregula TaxID=2649730 RepID=UPI0009D4E647|nr:MULTISPECIES: YkgJ family cysteine cluster protein [unclassified Methanoregula]OPX64879.1 MAG: Flagellin N-methylase [Methanoregula sp. PtaB.Bin085]OPY32931.1 MAG: Flagellin N-methylase [Methanoregula sp. PtaU1.Bin006]